MMKELRGFWQPAPRANGSRRWAVTETQNLAATNVRKTNGATEMTYNHNSQALQARVLEPLDDDLADPNNYFEAKTIPSDAYERRSTSAWQAKLNAAPDSSVTIHAILKEWLTGCYDEEIAIGWLQALQLLQEPQEADCYEAMCNLAFFELGPVALPERRTAPIPSVSSSQPFAPADRGAI